MVVQLASDRASIKNCIQLPKMELSALISYIPGLHFLLKNFVTIRRHTDDKCYHLYFWFKKYPRFLMTVIPALLLQLLLSLVLIKPSPGISFILTHFHSELGDNALSLFCS